MKGSISERRAWSRITRRGYGGHIGPLGDVSVHPLLRGVPGKKDTQADQSCDRFFETRGTRGLRSGFTSIAGRVGVVWTVEDSCLLRLTLQAQ